MKMLISYISALFLFFTIPVFSDQIFYSTANGKNIVLEPDGTWRYTDDKDMNKSENAKSFVSSKMNSLGLFFNDTVWRVNKVKFNESAEFEFSMKNGLGFGLMINEPFELTPVLMRKVVLDNLKSVADEVKIVREEIRVINSLPVQYLEIEASLDGVEVLHMSYIYTGEGGTTQIIAYTVNKSNFERMRPSLENFLNGLSKQ